MIHITSNLNQCAKSVFETNDYKLCRDIVLSEVGFLIAHDKKNVIVAIRESGIPIKGSPIAEKKIIDTIIENIGTNKKLQVALAILIADANEESNSNLDDGLELSEAGTNAKGNGGSKVNGETVTAIASGIGSIFGFAKSVKDAKAEKEANKNQLLASLLAAKQGGGSSNNTALFVILGILGLAIAGGIVYYAMSAPKIPIKA